MLGVGCEQDIGLHYNQCLKNAENVVHLFGTLPRALRKLKKEMSAVEMRPGWPPSRAKYRGKFCEIVRTFRSTSRVELCQLLNRRAEIEGLRERYLGFRMHTPLTPEFIFTFESEGEKLLEYCTHGLLFGIGFPTDELTQLVAKVLDAETEYVEFREWCIDYFTPWPGYFRI